MPDEQVVIIGATALGFALEMNWRKTIDLDLFVSVGAEHLPPDLVTLGWSNDPSREHRWKTPHGVLVDVIPVDSAALASGKLVWPGTGIEMNVTGFRLAFSQAVKCAVEGLDVWVAPLWVVVLLKIVAYLDRPAERVRDLSDIAFCLCRFTGDHDELQPDEVLDIIDRGFRYEQAGSFLIGKHLARIIDEEEREHVHKFIQKARDESDVDATQAKLIAHGPPSWRGSPQELLDCLVALETGLAG